MLGLGGIHPTSGHHQFHSNMVGNPAPEFDHTAIRQDTDIDFRKGKGGMFLGNNNIATQHHFKTATTGDPINGTDDRFVKISRIVQSPKPSGAIF